MQREVANYKAEISRMDQDESLIQEKIDKLNKSIRQVKEDIEQKKKR